MAAKAQRALPELTRTLERVARRLTGRRARILASHPDVVHSTLSAVADVVIRNTNVPDPGRIEVVTIHGMDTGGDLSLKNRGVLPVPGRIEVVSIHGTDPGGDRSLKNRGGRPNPGRIEVVSIHGMDTGGDLSLKNRGGRPKRLFDSLPDQLAALPAELTPGEVRVLADHPTAIRSVLKAAAAWLARQAQPDTRPDAPAEVVGDTRVRLVPVAEARRRMAERAGQENPEVLLSSDEIAMRLGLKTRQSVHDWMRKGRLLGWQGARRGYVFPAGQLDDRDRPLDGLQRIGQLFGDAYAAWVWMTTPKAALDDECPLALLAGGEVERAVEAAEGDLQGDFA